MNKYTKELKEIIIKETLMPQTQMKMGSRYYLLNLQRKKSVFINYIRFIY